LGPLFWLAANAPRVARSLRLPATFLAAGWSGLVRTNTEKNARGIFGRRLAAAEQRRFTRAVVRSFYDFVLDVGRGGSETREGLLGRIAEVHGRERYLDTRAEGRGAVLVTAHMGSFEVGLALLASVERPGSVQVVFKRDTSPPFEAMRARLRALLGVAEAPIDDGLVTWMDLRDALLADGVVVMQGDRAMPGQRSEIVPFLHGRLSIPTGAVRLAQMTGSPIIPVYTVRLADGRFAVYLHAPIDPGIPGSDARSAALAIGQSIASVVGAHPEQWLALWPAFEEESPRG